MPKCLFPLRSNSNRSWKCRNASLEYRRDLVTPHTDLLRRGTDPLCSDHFHTVYPDFGSRMSEGQRIQRLLGCDYQDPVEMLLKCGQCFHMVLTLGNASSGRPSLSAIWD